MKSHLFIFGVPRSGTTLLQSILNRHPEIEIIPETHYYVRCADYSKSALEDWIESDEFRSLSIDEISLNRTDRKSVFESTIDIYLDTNRPAKNLLIVGEKTPGHYDYVDAIQSDFPSAKFLWLARDPRAIVASHLDVPWLQGRNIVGPALRCRKFLHLAEKYSTSENHKMIRYEDLVLNLNKTLVNLGKFLKVKDLVVAESIKSERLVSSMPGKWQANHLKRAGESIDKDSLKKFQKKLRFFEKKSVEFLCSDQYRHLDYGLKKDVVGLFTVAIELMIFLIRNPRIVYSKLSKCIKK